MEVEQKTIKVNDKELFVTHLPTATSGMWFIVHDACEIFGCVAIELDGTVVGWKNPPDKHKGEIEKAIRQAFELPEPLLGCTPAGVTKCPQCGGELNIVEGGQTNEYAWETSECLKCQLAISTQFTENETKIVLAKRSTE